MIGNSEAVKSNRSFVLHLQM